MEGLFSRMDLSLSHGFELLEQNVWLIGLSLIGILIIVMKKQSKNLPPGPMGIPFIGGISEIKGQDKLHVDIQRLSKKYGDVFSIYCGTKLFIFLNSHQSIKEAFFHRGADFADRMQTKLADFAGQNDEIFTSQYTDKWREAKKFGAEALRTSGFGTRASEDKILTEVKEILSYLKMEKGAAVDLTKPFYWTACNVICSVLLNTRYTWDSKELNRVVKGCQDFLLSTAEAFNLEMLLMYMPFPLLKYVWPSKVQEVSDLSHGIRNFIQERINEHRQTFDASHKRDFLDIYIKDGLEKNSTDNAFVSMCSVFFPDAVLSMGDTMLWVLLYLGHYPHVQEKAQRQIDEVCINVNPSLKHRQELTQIEAIILETLRLSNLVPISPDHVPLQDTTLAGYKIPKKDTIIMANFYAAHMDPKLFPNPDEFKPSRFLNKKGQLKNSDLVLSFGIGKRKCMGELMAKSELFLLLSHLLQNFTFRFPEGEEKPPLDPNPEAQFTLKPYNYKICAIPRHIKNSD